MLVCSLTPIRERRGSIMAGVEVGRYVPKNL